MTKPIDAARLDAPGVAHAEWIAATRRLAPLIDGVDYFRALRTSLLRAREQVLIVGWEIHSEIDLLRGDEAEAVDDGWPVRFADVLYELVDRHEDLHVSILIWEGASLFAVERQTFPRMKRPWSKHPRVDLVWDEDTPRLASHHQKLVVIDDLMAFAGGIDVTKARWDDHDHEPYDERRRKPGPWPTIGMPYHDLMLALDGDAARAMGAWCRERWRRATGDSLPTPTIGEDEGEGHDRWPDEVEPLLRDRPVAIALTQPDHAGRPEKRQIEQSYVEQIRAAERLIYIESQYLTADTVVDALCERLREDEGPEVIIILPYGCPGKLQSAAMDPRRDELLDQLRSSDGGERLGVYWATRAGASPDDVWACSVYVHAKAMIIDDRLLRIGSANLSNRSMGVDTELDVFTQVDDDDAEAIEAIAGFRRRLLAFLMGDDPKHLAEAEREHGSLLGALRARCGGDCTLHPFDHRAPKLAHTVSPPIELADPRQPLDDKDADDLLEQIEADAGVLDRLHRGGKLVIGGLRRWAWLVGIVATAVALAIVWTVTPLSDLVDRDSLRGLAETVRSSSLGVAGVAVGFVVLASVGAPVTLMVAIIGAMFSIWWAVPLSLGGVAVSALIGFAIGRLLPDLGSSVSESGLLGHVARKFANRGVLTVAILRNLPMAPFAVVNVACGMTSLGWGVYLLGTLIGMLPGVVLIAIFGTEIGQLIAEPTVGGLLKVAGVAALVIIAAIGADAALRRWAGSDDDDDAPASEAAS